MAGLKDVAEKANVSISTVSYVLNGKKKVKEDTYQRIRTAVKETGYDMNKREKNTRIKKEKIIGLIMPNIGNYACKEYVEGIADFLEEHGYEVICMFGRNDVECEERCLNRLKDQKVAGIIFAGMMHPDKIKEKWGDLPVVHIDRILTDGYAYVDINHRVVSQMAIEHLLEKGRTHIAFISGPLRYQSSREFMAGVTKTLFDHGICYDDELICECNYTVQDGYEAMMYLLSRKKLIDAVFAADDDIAIGVIQALHSKKIRIPEDIAVVGFNDYPAASVISPSLTTLKKPTMEMGRMAAGILLSMIRKPEIVHKKIEVPSTLIIREST